MAEISIKTNNSALKSVGSNGVTIHETSASLKEAIRPSAAANGRAVDVKAKRILIIDDDEMVCMMVKEALPIFIKKAPFGVNAEVTAPSSLSEVDSELKSTKFDLVLLDGNLKCFSTSVRGPDVAAQIRNGDYPLNHGVTIVDISSGQDNRNAFRDIIALSKTRLGDDAETLSVLAGILRKNDNMEGTQSRTA